MGFKHHNINEGVVESREDFLADPKRAEPPLQIQLPLASPEDLLCVGLESQGVVKNSSWVLILLNKPGSGWIAVLTAAASSLHFAFAQAEVQAGGVTPVHKLQKSRAVVQQQS